MSNDEYRRTIGMDMLEAERQANKYRLAKSEPKPVVDERKQQDEQCESAAIGATFPHLLPNGTQYFSSFDDFLAWCDTEGGATD